LSATLSFMYMCRYYTNVELGLESSRERSFAWSEELIWLHAWGDWSSLHIACAEEFSKAFAKTAKNLTQS